jgi:hypothetical protein
MDTNSVGLDNVARFISLAHKAYGEQPFLLTVGHLISLLNPHICPGCGDYAATADDVFADMQARWPR